MFEKKTIDKLILSTLVADAYSLGAHWIYDEKQLATLDIDWNNLNDPKAIWHKGKKAGEFTHYGDQIFWLYQYLQDKDSFDVEDYIQFWENKIEIYNGYIDGATKQTIENIKDEKIPTGSTSTDLSIVGRIAPLLMVSKSKDEFLSNIEKFVTCTHNSNDAINVSNFIGKLLLMVLDGKAIEESILILKDSYDSKIQNAISKAISSKNSDTFESIRDFGPACDIDGGFEGALHLLLKYDNFKDMLICNAKAGGDSSARAMIAALIFMAQNNKSISQVPTNWLNIKAKII